MVGVRVGLIHHQGVRGPLVLLLALLPDLLPVLAPVLAPSQVVRCTWVCIARICVYASRMHTLPCMCMLCAEQRACCVLLVYYLYAASRVRVHHMCAPNVHFVARRLPTPTRGYADARPNERR